MSLHPHAIGPVPDETARIARAVFPHGNPYLQLRDVLGSIYADEDFADLFPRRGQAAEAPWRLALVTVLQFAEGLSDRQAAEAVRRSSRHGVLGPRARHALAAGQRLLARARQGVADVGSASGG